LNEKQKIFCRETGQEFADLPDGLFRRIAPANSLLRGDANQLAAMPSSQAVNL
jgi:hypothetical protein